MGYFSWYIMINLLGHIHRDGVGVTLNIIRDRIVESNIIIHCFEEKGIVYPLFPLRCHGLFFVVYYD